MLGPYLQPDELPDTQLQALYEYAMSFVKRNDGDLMETLFSINLTLFRDYEYVSGSTDLETTPFDVYQSGAASYGEFKLVNRNSALDLEIPSASTASGTQAGQWGDTNNPTQVWRITPEGHIALAQLRERGIREIVLRADPVDLAISRLDVERAERFPALLQARLSDLAAMIEQSEAHTTFITQYLSPLEQYVMEHKAARLRAEIAWTQGLLDRLPELLDHEKSRKDDR